MIWSYVRAVISIQSLCTLTLSVYPVVYLALSLLIDIVVINTNK